MVWKLSSELATKNKKVKADFFYFTKYLFKWWLLEGEHWLKEQLFDCPDCHFRILDTKGDLGDWGPFINLIRVMSWQNDKKTKRQKDQNESLILRCQGSFALFLVKRLNSPAGAPKASLEPRGGLTAKVRWPVLQKVKISIFHIFVLVSKCNSLSEHEAHHFCL